MSAENDLARAVARINAYLRDTGMAPSRLGALACANTYAIERIRAGTAQANTVAAVLDYIRQHPPKKGGRT